jgi:hypothetical protein
MQQSLEQEVKAIHAWAKKAPKGKKEVNGEHDHVDYTLTVDETKLAVVILTKQGRITARELAILNNYKTGDIWKYAYIIHIYRNTVYYQEISKIQGSFHGNIITPDITQFNKIEI